MQKFATLVVFLLLVQAHELFSQPFSSTPVDIGISSYEKVEWVDLDNDKDFDVLILNWVERAHAYRNDNGTFTDMGDMLLGETWRYEDYQLLDFDGNGLADIVFAGSGIVHVLLNQGNFEFTLHDTGINFVYQRSTPLNCVDLDNDGDIDILFNGRIFMNTDGVFEEGIAQFPAAIGKYFTGDINSDGKVDLMTVDYSQLVPYTGKGNGVFEQGTPFAAIRSDGTFFLVDADGDADLDVFVSEANYTYSLYRNKLKQTGTLSFERGYTFTRSGGNLATFGDINRDGLVDFLLHGYGEGGPQAVVYLNTSTPTAMTFTESVVPTGTLEATGPSINLVDFDADGDLDVNVALATSIYGGPYGNNTIYINEQGSPLMAAPTVPVNPATETGEDITLSWDAQPKKLYVVEIERNNKIITPKFAMDDGTLFLTVNNVGELTDFKILKNLPAGDYKWRVQALDYAGRSSAFTNYLTFTVEAAPHSLAVVANDFTDVNLSWMYAGATPTSFVIYRQSKNEALEEIGRVNGTETSFHDQTLAQNVTYAYVIRAVTGTAFSAPSASVQYYSGQFEGSEFGRVDPNIISGTAGTADMDNDNDYDLQFMGRVNADSQITMVNDGTGNFTGQSLLPPGDWDNLYSQLLYLGDMDSDGDVDMCFQLGSGASGRIAVMTNTNGTYVKNVLTESFNYLIDQEVQDFNNDGLQDIFYATSVGNGNPSHYYFLYQKRDGTFTQKELVIGPETYRVRRFQAVDINSDGFMDLFFAGDEYPNTKALLAINTNGNVFTVRETNIFPYYDIHFQDINGDGNIDVLYKFENERLVMHAGSGTETFGDPVFIRAFGIYNEMSVVSADLDFNGWPELIITDGYNVGVMKNNGNGSLEVAPYTFDRGYKPVVTDLEADGDVDVLIMRADQHQGVNTLYTNNWKSASRLNASPSAPTGLTTTFEKGAVRFEWTSSADTETPTKLLTYNVTVKDAEGKFWVHPGTNATGTFRNVLRAGNAGAHTFFIVNELPAGTYTATVQAQDASFALSPVSTPHTFSIEPGPTNLTVERMLLNKVKLTWTNAPAGGTEVLVERKTSSTDFEVLQTLPAGTTELIDNALIYNDVYVYRVRAIVNGAQTTHSNQAEWNTALWVPVETTIPNAQGSMDVADVNADGKMDFLLGGGYQDGYATTRVKAVFEKNDSGYTRKDFGNPDVPVPTLGNTYFTNVNNDAAIDIYEYGYSNGYKAFAYTNDGTGTFTAATNPLTQNNLQIAGSFDYDLDNDLDVFTVLQPDNSTPSMTMYRNNAGTYEKVNVLSSACLYYACPAGIVAGDFDRDGDEDFFKLDGALSLYLNSSEGFKQTQVTLSSSTNGSWRTLDFDGDGWLDVMYVSGEDYYTNSTKIYRNTGLDTNQTPVFEVVNLNLPAWSSPPSHNAADYDHDGDLDLMLVARDITFLSNNNDKTFQRYVFPKFRSAGASKTIDFDGDGDLDILLTGYMLVEGVQLYTNKAMLLENKLIDNSAGIRNEPPAAPANLRSSQGVNGISLEWDVPADDHTAAGGLTYDVILYKDGQPIFKSANDPVTGNRTKLVPGRVSNKLLLANITGSYQWKVQAIDQNYRGSAFSELSTINALPSPPVMNDTTIYRCSRTITLTAKGQNIKWYNDANKTTLLASGTYSPVTSQTVFVTQTINGMEGVGKTVTITIHERPAKPTVITQKLIQVCEGESRYISMQAVGSSLAWFSDSQLKNRVATGTYYFTEYSTAQGPKSFYVTQTVQQCESEAEKVDVAIITINPKLVVSGGTIQAAETEGDSYTWYRDNLFIGSGSNKIEIGGTKGKYQASIYKDGCYTFTDPVIITITGVNDEVGEGITLAPNPASTHIRIHAPALESFTVFSSDGREVYEAPGSESTLSVQGWPEGLYTITLKVKGKVYSRRFIVSH